jgi:hypothetical protein
MALGDCHLSGLKGSEEVEDCILRHVSGKPGYSRYCMPSVMY